MVHHIPEWFEKLYIAMLNKQTPWTIRISNGNYRAQAFWTPSVSVSQAACACQASFEVGFGMADISAFMTTDLGITNATTSLSQMFEVDYAYKKITIKNPCNYKQTLHCYWAQPRDTLTNGVLAWANSSTSAQAINWLTGSVKVVAGNRITGTTYAPMNVYPLGMSLFELEGVTSEFKILHTKKLTLEPGETYETVLYSPAIKKDSMHEAYYIASSTAANLDPHYNISFTCMFEAEILDQPYTTGSFTPPGGLDGSIKGQPLLDYTTETKIRGRSIILPKTTSTPNFVQNVYQETGTTNAIYVQASPNQMLPTLGTTRKETNQYADPAGQTV